MNLFWDLPCGGMVHFNDKEELCTFLNKTQLHWDCEYFSNDETFGIGIQYDYEAGEYKVEVHEVNNDCYVIPIHQKNWYIDSDKQLADTYSQDHYVTVKSEDLCLDNRWSFPCNVYIWIEDTFDRMGTVEYKMFHVIPCGKEITIQSYQKEEDEIGVGCVERLEYYCGLENKINHVKLQTQLKEV